MIYVAGWVVNYILLGVSLFTSKKRLSAALSILVLGLVVVLRGRVGADTGIVYESMAKSILSGTTTEPFFAALLIVMVVLFPTPLLAVTMGIGSIFVILLLIYVYRAEDQEIFILLAFVVPAAFWGMSISGQRYGIAFCFLLLAMQSVRLKQYKWAIILGTIAVLTHYSALVFILLWGLMILRGSVKAYLKMFGALTLTTVVVTTLAIQHFNEKFILYFESDYTAPSKLSGLMNIFAIVLLVGGIALGSLENTAKIRVAVVSFLGMIVFVVVTQYSYGGLRLLGIVETAVPYAALALYQKAKQPFQINFKTMILIVGLVGAIATYRNMLDEDRVLNFQGRSLPYTFFWEE